MSATATDNWHEANKRYLKAALNWLNLRLERHAGHAPAPIFMAPAPAEQEAQPASRWSLLGRPPPAPASPPAQPVLALPPPSGVTDEQIAQAAAEMEAVEKIEPPPALIILSQRLGLSRFERDVLLLCAAIELDARFGPLCGRAQGEPAWPYPTFSLALAVFDDPTWNALSPDDPLRYWRLIEIHQPSGHPLTTSPLRADERIVNYLNGLEYLDDRLTTLLVPLEVDAAEVALPPSQEAIVTAIRQHVERSPRTQRLPPIQLLGIDAPSKQLVASAVAAALGLHLYRLPIELLPTQAAELETLARLWQRESILLPIALYLDAHEIDGAAPSEGQAPPLNRFLARSNGFFFLDTRDIRSEVGRVTAAFDIAKPTQAEQQAAWAAALGSAAGDSPALLASQFSLNAPAIQRIAQSVLAEAPDINQYTLHDRLWDACLLSTRPRLEALAQRIEPKATWEAIVLPESEENLLRQIADQVGQRSRVYDEWGFRAKSDRGLGISALFIGESGTGKTMAAEVIANHLRLNLYRIDLSAVVSKYIGETEKNLRRLFDAAEAGGAILFFDEADALFGKRSEVKDSHDRYANIEINYLLQRMEAYSGLAILATNMKSALDPAFMRRIRFVVQFMHPGAKERKAIWQRVFPRETPAEGLDFDRLARLNLTGGNIVSIAINAAFMAAHQRRPVTMDLVLKAAEAEFRKLERPINKADFYWEEPARQPAGATA